MTHTHWLRAGIATVLIVELVAAVLVVIRAAQQSPSEADCRVVSGVFREWASVGPDGEDRGEVIGAFAERTRAAADSVSSSSVRDDLNSWAEGAGLLAEIRRGPDGAMDDNDPTLARALGLVVGAADELLQACPESYRVEAG
ncbi:hypothetical protein MHAS_01135 [Mycolicibacterium hassiacum DSM 44199]|uniref:hypothetical protein n=1 Tax=Mycolicibacterium hassiacum TaxID=46351 RepID=UPI000366E6CA|nr:hypothetical protein [Mycolicibacterium hassiacum]MBX5487761.1 hypothetical protein [Mycolicibacterium hassiacum]MDA4085984.1 hypothetical protein [Mycolicibacterium hassiacum DSM 44199]VCT89442.1 hypothetical protein MHAS_01135 [Mycolicibacterium hassiacum DSM 44199]